MPPQLSDDETSEVSSNDYPDPAAKKKSKSKSKTPVVDEPEPAAADLKEEESEEEEELPGDVYTVEAITNHLVDEDTGALRFEVKWLGYEKKSERTWETEENLETAPEVLEAYLKSVGGKESILAAWEEKKAEAANGKKGKKRGRASTGGETNGGAKRGRKSKGHPAAATPPLSATSAEFKPPTGSWEDAVVAIDACEGNDSNVVVYLTWKGGHKTQHPLAQVYKRCPQKMLTFYESHLVFKKNEDV